ncbi:MAG: hypothetical protein ABR874_18070 [Candidatus Sulfotelmatobacter sp.]|jgi:hypothetical protein
MWGDSRRPPCPKKNDYWHKHLHEGVPDDPIESTLVWKDSDRHSALYEAYKKHSAELRAIEDGENKLLLLIIAIFGAGVTAASKVDLRYHLFPAILLTLVSVGLIYLDWHVVGENHDLRIVVRELLVRCEQAMGFYTPDAFLKGRTLYQDAERHYACKGESLRSFSRIVVCIAGGSLIVLIWCSFVWGPILPGGLGPANPGAGRIEPFLSVLSRP